MRTDTATSFNNKDLLGDFLSLYLHCRFKIKVMKKHVLFVSFKDGSNALFEFTCTLTMVTLRVHQMLASYNNPETIFSYYVELDVTN